MMDLERYVVKTFLGIKSEVNTVASSLPSIEILTCIVSAETVTSTLMTLWSTSGATTRVVT